MVLRVVRVGQTRASISSLSEPSAASVQLRRGTWTKGDLRFGKYQPTHYNPAGRVMALHSANVMVARSEVIRRDIVMAEAPERGV